jgi:hypothetical protein
MTTYQGRGSTIGSYRIEGEILRTRSTIVYRAVHATLGRSVAIKVLADAPRLRGVIEQFVREAQVLDRLSATRRHQVAAHPGEAGTFDRVSAQASDGVARVYECGVLADGRPWFATDELVGPTLAEVIASGARIDIAYALGQLAAIVDHAHAAGIAHRNLRAENVVCVVGASGVRLVIDGWTTTRELAQMPSDAAGDIHALGLIALQMLGGVMAFSSGALAMLANTAASVRFARAPGALTALVDRMLARDLRRRPLAAEIVATTAAMLVAARAPQRQAAKTVALAVPVGYEVEFDAEMTRVQQVA